jgi:hypothetical protein
VVHRHYYFVDHDGERDGRVRPDSGCTARDDRRDDAVHAGVTRAANPYDYSTRRMVEEQSSLAWLGLTWLGDILSVRTADIWSSLLSCVFECVSVCCSVPRKFSRVGAFSCEVTSTVHVDMICKIYQLVSQHED